MEGKAETLCGLCGESMAPGEQMFKYHGLLGPCPKPPLPKVHTGVELIAQERLRPIPARRRRKDREIPKAA
jgi:hypothetical protein